MVKQAKNINDNETEAVSHRQAILEFLLTGCSLTVLEALKYFNCMALSQRVSDLNRDGWCIQVRMIKTEFSKKRIAQYYL